MKYCFSSALNCLYCNRYNEIFWLGLDDWLDH